MDITFRFTSVYSKSEMAYVPHVASCQVLFSCDINNWCETVSVVIETLEVVGEAKKEKPFIFPFYE